MAISSISKKAISTLPTALPRRIELLDDLALKINHAMAIADVLCSVNELESLNEHTMSTLGYIQWDILSAAKKLANSDEVRS